MNTIAEIARSAASLIDERGLYKGDLYDPYTGATCALGAIRAAVAGHPGITCDIVAEIPEYMQTVDGFAKFLGVESIPDWNDEEERTAEDVRDQFLAFAEEQSNINQSV